MIDQAGERRREAQIGLETRHSKHEQVPRPGRDMRSVREQFHNNARRRLSLAEKLLLFAAIPSLLLSAVIIPAISGDFESALQVACTATAAGFVGWYLGGTIR